jgi:hypothetical protein
VAVRSPAWVPRDFLENPDEFGIVSSPDAREAAGILEAGQRAMSLAQHQAALVIKAKRDNGTTSVTALAEAVGVSDGYLSGQLTGRYVANLDDLVRWAIVLDDVTLLPVFDSLDKLRPTLS